MKKIFVPPAVSWTILGAGSLIAVFFVWKAYDTISYLTEVQKTTASYYQVTR